MVVCLMPAWVGFGSLLKRRWIGACNGPHMHCRRFHPMLMKKYNPLCFGRPTLSVNMWSPVVFMWTQIRHRWSISRMQPLLTKRRDCIKFPLLIMMRSTHSLLTWPFLQVEPFYHSRPFSRARLLWASLQWVLWGNTTWPSLWVLWERHLLD